MQESLIRLSGHLELDPEKVLSTSLKQNMGVYNKGNYSLKKTPNKPKKTIIKTIFCISHYSMA